jgi:hypothetical protein
MLSVRPEVVRQDTPLGDVEHLGRFPPPKQWLSTGAVARSHHGADGDGLS